MVAIAGQPEYVGVMVTTTSPPGLADVAEHAEVLEREHRHLRVGDRGRERVGAARLTTAPSGARGPRPASRRASGDSASVWPRPAIGADLGALDAGDREDLVEHHVDLGPGVVRRARSSAYSGQTAVSPASSRRRDSSVPWARVRNQRPA